MSQSIKRFCLFAVLLLASGVSGFSFALLGPIGIESYQVPTIGYDIGADIGTPRNFGQGYRYNLTNLYYACDRTFTGYFGSNGVNAVDQAFYVFNSLSNFSSYSTNLAEFPNHSTTRPNYTAAALTLLDVKSKVMSAIIEELGLAEPDRWVYALHDRYTGGSQCGVYTYLVDQRNFDPVTLTYSSYVNDTLYDYHIEEYCSLNPNPFAPELADAIEDTVDATDSDSAVAAIGSAGAGSGLQPGYYFVGLTRDDVGGLRYLYSPTNVYVESAESNSFLLTTNTASGPQLLQTLDLSTLLQFSATNNAAAVIAQYPGLVINSSVVIGFQPVVTPSYYFYITNPPYAPYGTFALKFGTNFSTVYVSTYSNSFANIVIIHSNATTLEGTVSITNGLPPFGAYGSSNYVTNIVYNNFTIPVPSGDFYILPTNSCGPDIILSNIYSTITTNIAILPFFTNGVTFTNANISGFTNYLATYLTNYFYAYYPVICDTNTAANRQGVDKINFIRHDINITNYDSLTGLYNPPITNYYYLTAVANSVGAYKQLFRRIVRQPDFTFEASDLAAGPNAVAANHDYGRTAPNWNISFVPTNGVNGGPGTIMPGVVVTLNNAGPIYENSTTAFLNTSGIEDISDANLSLTFTWGSFDGTTNAPVVYPNATSINNLVAQLYFQVTVGVLPTVSVSTNSLVAYSQQLTAQGGTPPYTWSYDALPSGLGLTPAGILYSSPTNGNLTVGKYSVNVIATDSGALTANKLITINVGP